LHLSLVILIGRCQSCHPPGHALCKSVHIMLLHMHNPLAERIRLLTDQLWQELLDCIYFVYSSLYFLLRVFCYRFFLLFWSIDLFFPGLPFLFYLHKSNTRPFTVIQSSLKYIWKYIFYKITRVSIPSSFFYFTFVHNKYV